MISGRRNNIVVTFIVLLIVGILFTFIGNLILSGTTELVKNGIKTEATVVDLISHKSKSSYTYNPEVEYKTETGEVIRAESNSGSNPPAYAKGDKVNIYYSKSNPQNMIIDSVFDIYVFPLIFITIGIIAIIIDIVILAFIIIVFIKIKKDKVQNMP